jgi:hypothetical protein
MTESNQESGIVLQLPNGKRVRVVLMDENGEVLKQTANIEAGVFGYENNTASVTMLLEEP